MNFIESYLEEALNIIKRIDVCEIEKAVELLLATRNEHGRLFVLGVGGSAANASHVVNDFRKIVGIESYAPTDNVSELTARTNDEGWDTVFSEYLKTSRLNQHDCVMVLSVGGGDLRNNVSTNLVEALKLAAAVGSRIIGVVGREGGYTARVADACVLIPVVNNARITPHTEAFQAIIWHLLVSHPLLKQGKTKWESVESQLNNEVV